MSRSTVLQSPVRNLSPRAMLCALALTLSIPVSAQQSIQVSENDGLLSVQASNTSASTLAQVLTDELGISVVVTGDTESLVNIDIVEEPLNKALAKLSPNHMLVRSSEAPDSTIVEVVLMMGEGSASGGGGSDDQFLPSGSPADDIIVEDQPLNDEGIPTDQVTDPANASDVPSANPADDPQNGSAPPPQSFDPVSGLPIDPLTGQPVQ